jgi:uncharacterized membrane protein
MVVGFDGIHRAAGVLAQLEALDAEGAIDLDDAVAVYRTPDGRLRLDQSVRLTPRQGATWGAVVGTIVGALVATPFTAGASALGAAATAATVLGAGTVTFGATGAVTGARQAAAAKRDLGLTEEFIGRVGGVLRPGQSAIFARAAAPHAEGVAERFRGQGGTVLRTTLPPEKAAEFQAVLDPTRDAPR